MVDQKSVSRGTSIFKNLQNTYIFIYFISRYLAFSFDIQPSVVCMLLLHPICLSIMENPFGFKGSCFVFQIIINYDKTQKDSIYETRESLENTLKENI